MVENYNLDLVWLSHAGASINRLKMIPFRNSYQDDTFYALSAVERWKKEKDLYCIHYLCLYR